MGDAITAVAEGSPPRKFVTLGMFIIDEFLYLDESGGPTEKSIPPQVSTGNCQMLQVLKLPRCQIGGGGTYANVGARIWYVC